ncbi:MAG: 30S ribosomal protein S20 [Candidatus Shapirobacteria bacterium]
MPITKSAIKALRQDRRRAKVNKIVRRQVKKSLKSARAKISADTLQGAYRQLDRAAKKHVIHRNKAARLKSRLARLLPLKSPKTDK